MGLWIQVLLFFYSTKMSPRWGFGFFLPKCRPDTALDSFYQNVAPMGLWILSTKMSPRWGLPVLLFFYSTKMSPRWGFGFLPFSIQPKYLANSKSRFQSANVLPPVIYRLHLEPFFSNLYFQLIYTCRRQIH